MQWLSLSRTSGLPLIQIAVFVFFLMLFCHFLTLINIHKKTYLLLKVYENIPIEPAKISFRHRILLEMFERYIPLQIAYINFTDSL